MEKIIVILYLFGLSAFATVFSPVTIKEQIKGAQSIVQGEVVSVTSTSDPELGIVSKVFLRADRWLGAEVENNHLEVFFPGGSLPNGDVKLVHGSPEFQPGEKVVIFAQDRKGRLWVRGMGLGKFSIKKVGRRSVIVNQIFPQVPDVGQMPLETFVSLVGQVKGESLQARFKNKYERAAEASVVAPARSVASISEPTTRSVAAAKASDETNKREPSAAVWLALLLGLLGAGVRISKKGEEK